MYNVPIFECYNLGKEKKHNPKQGALGMLPQLTISFLTSELMPTMGGMTSLSPRPWTSKLQTVLE